MMIENDDFQNLKTFKLDPIENYFECISSCDISDGQCISKCIEILKDNEF